MDDDCECFSGLIGIAIVVAIVGVVIYLAVILASVLAGVAAVAGTVWGGGTAIVNYCKSFKANMIDSNIPAKANSTNAA